MKQITPEDRRRLAAAHGINEQYLYQCLAGLRDMNPGRARWLEEASGGELTRRSLCQKTWRQIWPELDDTDIAVKAPTGPDEQDSGFSELSLTGDRRQRAVELDPDGVAALGEVDRRL